MLAAGKPVKKELDSIRSKTKSLPAILGGEPSIKISEKDFERIMDMAQASGTLEKLNEAWWTYFWSHKFNDFDQIDAAFKEAKATKGMPTAIIAKTVKDISAKDVKAITHFFIK